MYFNKTHTDLLIALEDPTIKTPRILIRPALIKKFTHGKEINKEANRS